MKTKCAQVQTVYPTRLRLRKVWRAIINDELDVSCNQESKLNNLADKDHAFPGGNSSSWCLGIEPMKR